jgi:1-acyl-sn-glycerol-3-phosphate acyltransferase
MSDFVPGNVTINSEPTRLRPNVIWRLLKAVLTPFFTWWVRTHAVGKQNIDDTQGGLLLLNHQSFLDAPAAGVHLKRPISYLAREELFKVPVVGWILRKTYTVSVSQTAFRGSSVRNAIDHMHQGFLVGIFPEGERTSGPVKKFKRGFLALVRRVDLPIYPVGIVGTDALMPVGSTVIRPGKVTVVYGKPLDEEERKLLVTGQDDEVLTEMMRKRVADCMTQGGFRPEGQSKVGQ